MSPRYHIHALTMSSSCLATWSTYFPRTSNSMKISTSASSQALKSDGRRQIKMFSSWPYFSTHSSEVHCSTRHHSLISTFMQSWSKSTSMWHAIGWPGFSCCFWGLLVETCRVFWQKDGPGVDEIQVCSRGVFLLPLSPIFIFMWIRTPHLTCSWSGLAWTRMLIMAKMPLSSLLSTSSWLSPTLQGVNMSSVALVSLTQSIAISWTQRRFTTWQWWECKSNARIMSWALLAIGRKESLKKLWRRTSH